MELAFARKEGQELGGLVSERRRENGSPWNCQSRFIRQTRANNPSGVTGNLERRRSLYSGGCGAGMGSNVEFEIVLPPEVTGAKENETVQCKGRVVRTDEPATGGSGDVRRRLRCGLRN